LTLSDLRQGTDTSLTAVPAGGGAVADAAAGWTASLAGSGVDAYLGLMALLTDQQQFDFLRDGVLRLDADAEILNALPLFQHEAEEKRQQLRQTRTVEGDSSSWDETRGWGDVQTRSNHLAPALSGRVGRIVRELLGSEWSDHIQYAFTEPTEGPDEFNEHRDGAKDANATFIGRYRLQIGILLDDVAEDMGPSIYWPGSHQLALLHASRNSDLTPVQLIRTNLKLNERIAYCPFVGSAGCVILSHPLVTHGTLRNRGTRVRPMAFVRVGWKEDDTRDLFDRPWADFPGLSVV
jgi:hypothetical protein